MVLHIVCIFICTLADIFGTDAKPAEISEQKLVLWPKQSELELNSSELEKRWAAFLSVQFSESLVLLSDLAYCWFCYFFCLPADLKLFQTQLYLQTCFKAVSKGIRKNCILALFVLVFNNINVFQSCIYYSSLSIATSLRGCPWFVKDSYNNQQLELTWVWRLFSSNMSRKCCWNTEIKKQKFSIYNLLELVLLESKLLQCFW